MPKCIFLPAKILSAPVLNYATHVKITRENRTKRTLSPNLIWIMRRLKFKIFLKKHPLWTYWLDWKIHDEIIAKWNHYTFPPIFFSKIQKMARNRCSRIEITSKWKNLPWSSNIDLNYAASLNFLHHFRAPRKTWLTWDTSLLLLHITMDDLRVTRGKTDWRGVRTSQIPPVTLKTEGSISQSNSNPGPKLWGYGDIGPPLKMLFYDPIPNLCKNGRPGPRRVSVRGSGDKTRGGRPPRGGTALVSRCLWTDGWGEITFNGEKAGGG